MANQRTAIEWTDTTWNPTTGCDKVSPGCDHCYAMTLAKRLKAMGNPRYQHDGVAPMSGPGFGVSLHFDKIEEPFRWREPRMVFVNSMSDLFHAKIPTTFVRAVFTTMALTPRHTYQVLTKRPGRMRLLMERFGEHFRERGIDWPLPNVWLGTSVEDQEHAEKRIPELARAEAHVRFLSCEPLLGPIELAEEWLPQLHWIIVGGESGHHYRPVDPAWVRALRDQSLAGGVAYFLKQWGGRTPKAGGRALDGRTWDEMPSARVKSA